MNPTEQRITITAVGEPDSIFLDAVKPRVIHDARRGTPTPPPTPDASPITFLDTEDEPPAADV